MRKSVVGINDGTKFITAVPYVYNGSAWVLASPKVYISGWQQIGGTGALFDTFTDNDGKNMVDNNGDTIFVMQGG